MYSSISTLFVILTILLTLSFSAQLNPKKSFPEVFIAAEPTSDSTLSKRGDELFRNSPSLNAPRRNTGDDFDPITNPNGFVNLGTAENVCSSFWSRVKPAHWPLFQYLAVPDVAEFVNRNVPSRLPPKISSIFGLRQG